VTVSDPVPGNPDDLAEQGRRLASEREDLVAQGVNPADLAVPLYPGPVPGNVPDELSGRAAAAMYAVDCDATPYNQRPSWDELVAAEQAPWRVLAAAALAVMLPVVRQQAADEQRQAEDALSAMLVSKYRHDTDWLLVNIRRLRNRLEAARVVRGDP
jgi:hypothetical protein